MIAELKAQPWLTCSIIHTLSAHNFFYLPELHDWADSVGLPYSLNPLSTPAWASTRTLPPAAKAAIRERMERMTRDASPETAAQVLALVEDMEAHDWHGAHFAQFVERTAWADRYRGESFADVFPELAELLSFRG